MIHERTRLLAITPDFDSVALLGEGHFSGDGRWCLIFSTFISAERVIYIMEADDASFQMMIVEVIAAELLGREFLAAIARFGIGAIRVFLSQRCDLGRRLLSLSVDASGRREASGLLG